jgi:ribosome-associated toxin RatA of RatAB toxin-antitoxin module
MMNSVFSKAFSRMMQAFIDQAEQRFEKVAPVRS